MSDIGVGVVGLGVHGARYVRHLLQDVQGARLVAVCRSDVDAGRKWARAHDVAFFADWAELVAMPAVEAVAVVTPPDLNATVALAAIAAGKAVLVEKPIAADLAGAERLRAASNTGPAVMVAQTLRYNGVVGVLRREIGVIGALRLLALSQRFEPSDRAWLDRPGPGGILLNTGIHSFDLVRHLSGREVLQASCVTRSVVTRRTPDTFVATLTLEDGILATVDNCRATGARSGRIELVGEHGQLVGDHVLGTAARLTDRGSAVLEVGDDRPTVRDTLAAFVACVREGTPPPIAVEDGLRALEIVVACETSARDRRPVELNEVRGG